MTRGGYIYILASKPNGTLYIGVTNDLVRRVGEHRSGETGGLTSDYGVTRLVYFERHEDIRDAIAREKRLKKWNREWKLNVVRAHDPEERDLFDDVVSHPAKALAMPQMDSRLRGNDGVGGKALGVLVFALLLAPLSSMQSASAQSATAAPATAQPAGDGMALVQAATDAARLGDAEMETAALRRLAETGFWTPPVVALARWTLASVPENAILLAQTDGDGVPLRMVQTTEALRPDVQVVQVDLNPALADSLAAAWQTSARPVVGALTLDPSVLGAHAPGLVMAGAYQRAGTDDEPPVDLPAAEASADAARGADFVGPRTSAQDRDPARRASPVDLSGVVLFGLLQTAVSHAQAGDRPSAERAYARAVTFARDARIADDMSVPIAREWIDEALASHPD